MPFGNNRGGNRGGPRRGGFNRGGSGGGFNRGPRREFSGPREMHKIKCSECGKDAEVPFKPRGDTPVFCRECFMKKKGITPRAPREEVKSEPEEEIEGSEEEEEQAEEETEEDSDEEPDGESEEEPEEEEF